MEFVRELLYFWMGNFLRLSKIGLKMSIAEGSSFHRAKKSESKRTVTDTAAMRNWSLNSVSANLIRSAVINLRLTLLHH